MPPEISDLISELEAAGFVNRRKERLSEFHASEGRQADHTLSGNAGDDAKRYQEKAVGAAIEESRR
jgi:hypothetical protein